MLTIKELKPRTYVLTLAGVVEKSDIETMKRELTPALRAEGAMGIVLRIENLEDMTGDALVEDARFEFGMMSQWSKVAKVAVVTDKQVLDAILRWIDPVLPMIEFRTFATSEANAAESWAADLSEAVPAEGPGIRIVEDGSESLLAFEIDGPLKDEDADRMFEAFDRATSAREKINLMVTMKNFEGFDLALLTNPKTMASKFGAISKIDRYAIVGAPRWMRSALQVMGPLLPIEMRTFDFSEQAAARAWARAA